MDYLSQDKSPCIEIGTVEWNKGDACVTMVVNIKWRQDYILVTKNPSTLDKTGH